MPECKQKKEGIHREVSLLGTSTPKQGEECIHVGARISLASGVIPQTGQGAYPQADIGRLCLEEEYNHMEGMEVGLPIAVLEPKKSEWRGYSPEEETWCRLAEPEHSEKTSTHNPAWRSHFHAGRAVQCGVLEPKQGKERVCLGGTIWMPEPRSEEGNCFGKSVVVEIGDWLHTEELIKLLISSVQ